MDEKEVCEVMGYLSNPLVGMRYDVQVPPKKRAEFERDYKQLTGIPACSPGSGGYSVLRVGVDKRAVQYRFSYVPSGSVPPVLQSISKNMFGSSNRKRVSNKNLLVAMFKGGFVLGDLPSRSRIIPRLPKSFFIHFEFGYASAFPRQESLMLNEFSEGFSTVDDATQSDFSLHDKEAAGLVHSVRAGRSAAFRHHVLQAYDNQCCVCTGSLVDLYGVYETEAAHIVPKSHAGSDDIRNGLALCRKHHWSFDRGMFGVDANHRVVVPNEITSIKENGSLKKHNKQLITLPPDPNSRPHPSALEWHINNIFFRG